MTRGRFAGSAGHVPLLPPPPPRPLGSGIDRIKFSHQAALCLLSSFISWHLRVVRLFVFGISHGIFGTCLLCYVTHLCSMDLSSILIG